MFAYVLSLPPREGRIQASTFMTAPSPREDRARTQSGADRRPEAWTPRSLRRCEIRLPQLNQPEAATRRVTNGAHAQSSHRRGRLAPMPRSRALSPQRSLPFNRIAYAAAARRGRSAADGRFRAASMPPRRERTIAFRRHLWSLGLAGGAAMTYRPARMGRGDCATSIELIAHGALPPGETLTCRARSVAFCRCGHRSPRHGPPTSAS